MSFRSQIIFICLALGVSRAQAGYDIAPRDVRDPAGCLNVQLFLERLRSFSNEAVVRQTVTDFRISTEKGRDQKPPREEFLLFASASNFKMLEQPITDFRNRIPNVRQNGCKTLEIDDGVNGKIEMKVLKARSTQLLLESSSERRLLELRGKREWLSRSTYQALDSCDGSSHLVQKTTLMRWGDNRDLGSMSELIRKFYLGRVIAAFENVPQAIRDLVDRAGKRTEIGLSRDQLRAFDGLQIKVPFKRCPTPEPTPHPE